MRGLFITLIFLFGSAAIEILAQSGSIRGSMHDLSVSGASNGRIGEPGGNGVCKFCHMTHTPKPEAAQWSHGRKAQKYYTLYDNTVSNTFNATAGQPDGASLLCLSCHDGTIALGDVSGVKSGLSSFGAINPSSPGYLGTDLSDDHPISFEYRTATGDQDIKPVPEFPINLDSNGKVQCTSCHNPHNNEHGKFLVETNMNSALCLKCHEGKSGWSTSSHSTSTASWNGTGDNPWGHIGSSLAGPKNQSSQYTKVSENACANCHDNHSARGKTRLLKGRLGKENCLDCHNGNVATTDINAQDSKPYGHNVSGYPNIHNPNEASLVTTKHVECQDCHNPHMAKYDAVAPTAPYASGALLGVKGVDLSGNPVTIGPGNFEYEVCNRCHTNSVQVTAPRPRQLGNGNVMNDFDVSNVSFHPVVGPRNNSGVTSLIAPLSQGNMIYCSDCHSSDGGGPAGPHGSNYPQILNAKLNRNLTEDTELPDNADLNVEFALCAQCHNMNMIETRHSTMGEGHMLRKTACTTCHDPHGFGGGDAMYNAYLMNFDTKVITPNSKGEMHIQMNGDASGVCNLKCHAHDHQGAGYGNQYIGMKKEKMDGK